MRNSIERVISPSGLDKRVGLMHYEFVQPMDNEPLDVGTYSGRLVRRAKAGAQPTKVTEWVEQETAAGAA